MPGSTRPSETDADREAATALEREAGELRTAGKIEEAFARYDEAAKLYQKLDLPVQTAICFAAAATCWDVHTGWQPLQKSASRNHLAANEAARAKHYDYAATLFRNAAMLYEKEGDDENFSACFVGAQHARRKKSWQIAFCSKHHLPEELVHLDIRFRTRVKHLLLGALGVVSDWVWGYGEKPFRTLLAGFVVILTCGVLYAVTGRVAVGDAVGSLSFLDSLYYSVVTFTTLGYGDVAPLGLTRALAALEALTGVVLIPLFLISLTRRFLRLSR